MKLAVLSAADGAAWEARLVADFERGRFGVEITRRCVDVVDLLAVAGSGQGRVALIDSSLRRLDADAVDRLAVSGVVGVAVVPRTDTAAEDRMRAIGIERVVPDDAEPAVVASVLSDAARAADPGAEPGTSSRVLRAYADPSRSMPVVAGKGRVGVPTAGGGDPAGADRRGSVVAVWGPTGAPGRTTVAVALADELSRLGSQALLVDADVYGGTVAAVLGVLDESPGLAAACRRSANKRLDADELGQLSWQLTPALRVLTGVPLASRWTELRPTALGPVLAAARSLADFTVVDCGFCLETDEELSFDTLAPRRNGATLAVLDDADLIVVVGAADPIGMQRLVRGLTDLREAEVGAPQWVVLNKVRDDVVPGDTKSELASALLRFAGRVPAALLPWDQPALDRALATGRMLSESAPNSALRRACHELAAALAGVPTRSARAGRRRR